MRKILVAAAIGGAALVATAAPSVAAAQSMSPTGAELYGHAVRVAMADGNSNTLYFQQDGTVRIGSAAGQELAQGRWFVQNQMLCMEAGAGVRECWPYRAAFEAQRAVNLTSDCGVTSQWTALSTNAQQPPQQRRAGERG